MHGFPALFAKAHVQRLNSLRTARLYNVQVIFQLFRKVYLFVENLEHKIFSILEVKYFNLRSSIDLQGKTITPLKMTSETVIKFALNTK